MLSTPHKEEVQNFSKNQQTIRRRIFRARSLGLKGPMRQAGGHQGAPSPRYPHRGECGTPQNRIAAAPRHTVTKQGEGPPGLGEGSLATFLSVAEWATRDVDKDDP